MISPLDLDDIREESLGFCHPFSGENKINDPYLYQYGSSILFGMREDKKKIPNVFFKLQVRQALESLGFATEEGHDENHKRVSKKTKDELKDKLKMALLKSILPTVKIVEILWNLETNEIWFYSQSAKLYADFEKLFREAFHLDLIVLNQGTLPIDWDRVYLNLPLKLEKLIEVLPTLFSTKNSQEKWIDQDEESLI